MPIGLTDQEHATPSDATAAALLETIRQLLAELRPHSANTLSVSLDSSLERDLGFDSLGVWNYSSESNGHSACGSPNIS